MTEPTRLRRGGLGVRPPATRPLPYPASPAVPSPQIQAPANHTPYPQPYRPYPQPYPASWPPQHPVPSNFHGPAAQVVNQIAFGTSKGFNHGFHAVMTLVTCGLWAPVWMLAYLAWKS